jgi:hypothetical protein
MADNYDVGKQPCQVLKRKYEGDGWPNVHECYRCRGKVSFCENCNRDHHEDGYETCQLKELIYRIGEYQRWAEPLMENDFANEGDKIFAWEQFSAAKEFLERCVARVKR